MQRLRPKDPESIGPYTLIARLGAGGMGTVFLGTDGTSRVAVKVANQGFLDDPSLRTRFEREIATLQRLDSRYVAKFLAAEVEAEMAWHAVEFVNGPTLKDKVELDGPLSLPEWFEVAQQLRAALADLATSGIVHRDLKPANIVLSESGLKLIDFGIAFDQDQTSVTTTGMLAGSPAWLAPEQLEGSEITPATDLFSAGSVLVFAASGRSPWGDTTSTTVPTIISRIISQQIDLSGLDTRQRDVVASLLRADPSERRWQLDDFARINASDFSPTPEPIQTQPQKDLNRETDQSQDLQSDESPASARVIIRVARWPAIPAAVGSVLFLMATSSGVSLSGFLLALFALIWLVVRAFRQGLRQSTGAAWMSAIIALPAGALAILAMWILFALIGFVLIPS